MAGADHESGSGIEKWIDTAPFFGVTTGITDAHGRVYWTNGGVGRFALGANYPTLTLRMRFRPVNNHIDQNILQMFDTTSNAQCAIRQLTTGALRVCRGVSTTIDTTATGLLTMETWYYLEWMMVINNSGSYDLRLWDDSGTELDHIFGSADTQETANAYATHTLWGDSDLDPYIEDLSIDVSGEIIGAPTRVETLYPSAAGDLADWPRGGTDTGNNWDQVNETVKDTVSYVQSSAADQFDAYNIDNRSVTGTPKAVQVNAIAAGIAGGETFKLLLRIGGVTHEGAQTQTVTTSDRNKWEVWDTNPDTGLAWTDTEINSLQIGYRSLSSDVRVHQCCLEVVVAL